MNQVHAEATISSAQQLLADGKVTDAQNLLLDEGYVKRLDPSIQEAYLALIPINPTLQVMLDEVYRGLDDPSPKVRFDAAMKLSREFSKERLRDNIRWMRDPRASEPLMSAARDPDRKVAERALGALARLICSYFPDQRSLPVFLEKLTDPTQLVRNNAIGGIGCLRREDALTHLVDLFDDGTDEDRMAVAGVISGLAHETWYNQRQHPIEWTPDGRKFWISKMIQGLRDPHAGVRRQVANALGYFGDLDAVSALQAARRVEPDDDTTFYAAYYIDEAIKTLQERV
jgi:HEAT repeat protein